MDTSALTKRYDNAIPASVATYVDKMKELSEKPSVLNVKLLANFGRDEELSLKHDTDILRGLVVQLASTYTLTNTDRLWLHPNLCSGRSMYQGGKAKTTDLDINDFNASVAAYTTHSIDDIGTLQSENVTIVDNGVGESADTLITSWILSGESAKGAYNELSQSKLNITSQKKRDALAEKCGATTRLMNSDYNMLYSDGASYYYYNHAIKPDKQALINVSPMVGCAVVQTSASEIESDLLTTSDFIDVNSLESTQRHRAYVDCRWKGKNIINTYTMRKPIEGFKEFLGERQGKMYRMTNGYFSANAVYDKLSLKTILALTPKKEMIPDQAVCHTQTREGVISMQATQETIGKLMKKNWSKLISKKYVKGDMLILPRSMIEDLVIE